MPVCRESGLSPTHLHAQFDTEHPFLLLEEKQKKAKKRNQFLAYNAARELKVFPWYVQRNLFPKLLTNALNTRPKMTRNALDNRFLGSSLKVGDLIPPRLVGKELDACQKWMFCYCIKKIPSGAPIDGCTFQILRSRPSLGGRDIFTCHLHDSNDMSKIGCSFFGEPLLPSLILCSVR